MSVVKANAYGHGAVEVGKTALAAGACWLAVARVGEALALRQAGITAPVLVLGMPPLGELDEAIGAGITLPLTGFEAAEMLSQRALAVGKDVNVHLKVDTGMGRLGVFAEEAVRLAEYAESLGGIHLDGIYSHFAMADKEDHPLMKAQLTRFQTALDNLASENIHFKWVHHANTGATLDFPESRFNLMRGGQLTMGLNPFEYKGLPDDLQPALTAWKSRLISCKEMPAGWGVGYGSLHTAKEKEIIGAASVGFGDGIRRVMGIEVLVGGRRVPVVGSTCMDQIMMSLPEKFPLNSEVVLIGTQGEESQTVEEFASFFGIVHVDLTTLINSRVPRVYYRSEG